MLPTLNSHGLLPPGAHPVMLDDIPPQFCVNDYRWTLWDDVIDGIDLLCQSLPQRALKDSALYLCGSFFSDKALPGDIEATLALPDNAGPDAITDLVFFCMQHQRTLKAAYRLDFYPTIPGQNDFTRFFQYAGPKTAKAKNIHPQSPRGIAKLLTW